MDLPLPSAIAFARPRLGLRFLNRRWLDSKSGDQAGAVQTLSQMVKANPSSEHAHLNLAIVYTQQNRYREAAEEFQEALRLDSTDDIARASLIKVLVILSEFSTALQLIQEYAQRKPHEFEEIGRAHV